MTRDYAFEALAEVTGTDWKTGRGELNKALQLIRDQAGIEDSFLLSSEIHDRAKAYRQVMGDEIMLTPTALAKHWTRVLEESQRQSKPQRTSNLSVPPTDCSTCGGDRFVVVALRKPKATSWMMERGMEPSQSESFEEYAPCPDCGPEVRGVPDPGRVREMMQR